MTFEREVRVGYLACGIGGGAKGFRKAQARLGNLVARFRNVGGVDVDASAIAAFDRIAGCKGTVLDLFDLPQYRAFHGHEPPPGWREAGADDIRAAFAHERPHIIFTSMPCKGFSGLLSEKASLNPKYQALNGLTLRSIWLALEAYRDDPVEFILFENVPRIATRGRALLDRIQALLSHYGYAYAETTHDCGELGGLAQSRKRFLMVARHREKVPPFLYEPPKRRLRGVGEVLGALPLPGDERGGPMHRMPSLQWRTWVRLAFVEAGSDWRSLNRLRVEGGVLADYAIEPGANWQAGVLGVREWGETIGVIAGRSSPTNGAFSVADPRPDNFPGDRGGLLGVNAWDDTGPTITSQRSPGQGRFSVADPRIDGHPRSVQMGVRGWGETAGVVTGKMFVGGGPNAVADPRMPGKPRFNNCFRIVGFGDTSPAVAGPGGPAGGLAVADPRAASGFGGKGKYRVTGYQEAVGTVIGGSTTGQGAFAVADPRTAFGEATHHNVLCVRGWDEPAKTVTGSGHPSGGAGCVADPRPRSLMAPGRTGYLTQGHYGVTRWDEPSGGVTASGQHDNGQWSVADPRGEGCGQDARATSAPCSAGFQPALPSPEERLVAVIQALDGTWHRPFTTLELAALQSLVDPDEMFTLEGTSDSRWREHIGNCVPPDAAAAIAGVMGRTLLLAWTGESFMLSADPIWVRPVTVALSVDVPEAMR